MKDIAGEIIRYHERLRSDPHGRFRSWEHCYKFFQTNPNDYDHASLHLAFYLASWGMYRGSTFLLRKDYLIHCEVVKHILDSRFSALKSLSIENLLKEEIIDMLLDLINWIKSWYEKNTTLRGSKVNVTDTLATKILLGTLGCTPAYDRFFIAGLRECGLSFSGLNKMNFKKMMFFCSDNHKEFEDAQAHVSRDGLRYPIVKIIDMYFWHLAESKRAK